MNMTERQSQDWMKCSTLASWSILSHFNLLVFVKCNDINFHWDEFRVGPIQNASPRFWISLSAETLVVSKYWLNIISSATCTARVGQLLKSGFFVLKYWLNISPGRHLAKLFNGFTFFIKAQLLLFCRRVALFFKFSICKLWLLVVDSTSC